MTILKDPKTTRMSDKKGKTPLHKLDISYDKVRERQCGEAQKGELWWAETMPEKKKKKRKKRTRKGRKGRR